MRKEGEIRIEMVALELAMKTASVDYTQLETSLFLFFVTTFAETDIHEFVTNSLSLSKFFQKTELEIDTTIKSLIEKDLLLVKRKGEDFKFALSQRASKILLRPVQAKGNYVH